MSLEINNNNGINKAGVTTDNTSCEKFEFKNIQVGSIFVKYNGDGKVSINDFNRTTEKLSEFIKQYADNASDWTKDTYNAIVGYLNKNKDEIKNEIITETISAYQTKANDNSQIISQNKDGDWIETIFKDGTSMRENKAENKVRYYDSQNRWIAGTTKHNVNYLNTYHDSYENLPYEYVSEEIGSNNIYYYGKNDKLIMTDDGKEKVIYIDGPDGKLQQVEQRDSKTGKLQLIGYADSNEQIIKTKEFKKDPISNKPYIEETDYQTNKSRKIFDAVIQADIFEVRDPKTGEVTYKKVIDHKNNTISITENGITTKTNMKTGEITKIDTNRDVLS